MGRILTKRGDEEEAERVFDHRLRRLLHLRFDSVQALKLAESDAEISSVEKAIARGCTHEQAVRIFA